LKILKYKNIILEENENIATITINRPEKRNALDRETWAEIENVFEYCENQDKVRVIIITGKGDKSFAAGADINALLERSAVETLKGKNQSILSKIESVSKPIIAAVNGYALGGGCELAMSADIRIASKNAKFGLPELNLGIIPGAGGTQRLARLVGYGRAKEMILTGRIIDAKVAKEYGLITEVCEFGNSINVAKEIAKKILKKGPLAVKLAKLSINIGTTSNPEAGMALELLSQSFLFGTEDHVEGLKAFLEKREADYKMK
jgi:enoyl-CoA hydratase